MCADIPHKGVRLRAQVVRTGTRCLPKPDLTKVDPIVVRFATEPTRIHAECSGVVLSECKPGVAAQPQGACTSTTRLRSFSLQFSGLTATPTKPVFTSCAARSLAAFWQPATEIICGLLPLPGLNVEETT